MRIVFLFALVMVLAGCQTGGAAKAEPAAYSVEVLSHIPYRNKKEISQKILSECNIGEPLSKSVQKYGKRYNIDVKRVDSVDVNKAEAYIKIEIVYAYSHGVGAPMVGHDKMVSIESTLYEKGKPVSSFERQRTSNGGFLAWTKNSCDVLDRTVNTLGNDVAKWIRKLMRERQAKVAEIK